MVCVCVCALVRVRVYACVCSPWYSDTDPMHLLNTMSHDLQELSAWMANVLEIANCARRLLRNLGVNPASASANASLSSLSGGTALDSAEAALDQELSESLTALQDIVIYAFQQVLYPVTKVGTVHSTYNELAYRIFQSIVRTLDVLF